MINVSFLFFFADSLMGSGSEDEDDDDPIRPPLNLGPLGPNGPESVGPMGASDLSVQSMSTDSKNGVDDSDQVIFFSFFLLISNKKKTNPIFTLCLHCLSLSRSISCSGLTGWGSRCKG
jgi:hypothetical protein